MANTTPSEQLAQSIASLSKSAYQALADVESRAQAEVARATNDARDARAEHDRAISALHSSQLEGQTWKQEVMSCKASLKQAALTIAQQTETITQLRREANQWRDQSLNWQEHFLRVEQERCGLSTKIEELEAESLRRSRTPISIPFLTDSIESTQSPSTKRASSSMTQPPVYQSIAPSSLLDDDSASMSINAQKRIKPVKITSSQVRPSPSRELPPYQRSNPRSKTGVNTPRKRKVRRPESHQTIIRHVQAVIHVKQEESDNDLGVSEARDKNQAQEVIPAKATKTSLKKQKVLPDSDHSDEPDEEAVGTSADIDGSYVGGREIGSDDEDELMLGAEENRRSRRIEPFKKSLQIPAEPSPIPHTKKRKSGGSLDHKKLPLSGKSKLR